MTSDEKQAHKAKVKKVMIDHLTELGYPNMSNEEIMNELKEMWLKIEEAGLVVEDMNFAAFQEHAHSQFIFQQMKDIMGI